MLSFHGPDGIAPSGALVFDSAGNLYGTGYVGGASNDGTVFELNHTADGTWVEKVLHSFNGADGNSSAATLIFDGAGNLYGTTVGGGAHNGGTVFVLKPTAGGNWNETVLYSFDTDGQDGFDAFAGVVFDHFGNLYGTTFAGGTYNNGTVFELTRAAGGEWTEQILHSFNPTNSDGTGPNCGVVLNAGGTVYGSTLTGGLYGQGTVYELAPSTSGGWTETVLHSFSGPDGSSPYSSPILGAAGNLYGTADFGGTFGGGTAFEITP